MASDCCEMVGSGEEEGAGQGQGRRGRQSGQAEEERRQISWLSLPPDLILAILKIVEFVYSARGGCY